MGMQTIGSVLGMASSSLGHKHVVKNASPPGKLRRCVGAPGPGEAQEVCRGSRA